MRVKIIVEREQVLSRKPLKTKTLKPGDIIESPDAYQLIQVGIAVPDDDESRLACGMDEGQIKQAAIAAERTRLGIHPDEFDLYAAGLMDGYNASGKPTLAGVKVSASSIREFRKANKEDDEEEETEDDEELLGSD
jgi:hypothetical protein